MESAETLLCRVEGFWEQLLLWAQLRFGLAAAAEFTVRELQSVRHLARDSSLTLI